MTAHAIAYPGAQFIPTGLGPWLAANGGDDDGGNLYEPQVEVSTFEDDASAGIVGLAVVYASDDSFMTAALTPDQAREIAKMLTAAADVAQQQVGAL